MKHLILPILSLTILFTACGPKQDPNTAVFSGEIINPTDEFVYLSHGRNEVDTAILDAEGKFSFTKELTGVKKFNFRHGNQYAKIVLDKGYHLTTKVNYENFDPTLQFNGDGAGVSTFYVKKVLLKEEQRSVKRRYYGMDVQGFLDTSLLFKEAHLALLDKHTIGTKGLDSLIATERADIVYGYYYDRITFPETASRLQGVEVNVADDYYDFISEVNLKDDNAISADYSYYKYLIKAITERELQLGDEPSEQVRVYDYFKANLTGKVQKYMLLMIMKEMVNYYPFEAHTASSMVDYKSTESDTSLVEPLARALASWEPLKPGNMAPDFAFPNPEGDTVHLSDFKGKLVYIDIWATWCGPCKRETPHLKTLIEEVNSDKVQFITLSMDEDQDAWKKYLDEHPLNAVALCAGSWHEGFTKDYNIKYIPRFLFIDREGKIITVDATRPSNPDTKALILENI